MGDIGTRREGEPFNCRCASDVRENLLAAVMAAVSRICPLPRRKLRGSSPHLTAAGLVEAPRIDQNREMRAPARWGALARV